MKTENKIKVLDLISPEMREVIKFYENLTSIIPSDSSYQTVRNNYNEDRKYWNEHAPDMHRIKDVLIPTTHGDILTRILQPTKKCTATLFYLHGGGFIVGNLNTHDRIMRLLALYTNCTVIGIDYTLSPEAHYPQAIQEISDICQYYHKNADNYDINMSQIGFAGDSAGAMLSLATTLWLRDNHIHCGHITALLLWYGLYGLQDSVSRRLYGGDWDGLRQQDLIEYDNAYLTKSGSREAPYYCLFNNDLTQNLPPCFIASAQYDPLLDDSIALYRTLETHNIPYEYKMYSGTLHAFLHYSRMMKTADNAIRDGANFFIKYLSK